MAGMGRKLARQNKVKTPEEKAEDKAAEKALPPAPKTIPGQSQRIGGHQPTTRMFQRKSGSS